ncbi:MAG: CHAT domain-containing protein [Bacteroidia bacterium]|nr:CHAT domain-containing protein [Bacteroidia bacterium]
MKTISASILFFLSSVTVCNSQIWTKTDSLRIIYHNRNIFDSALYFAEETAALVRANYGENSVQYADVLNTLAVSHYYLGNLVKAKYYALKEVGLRETLNLDNTDSYIHSLENASIICRTMGNNEEALTLIKKAEPKASRIYGSGEPRYADILSSIACIYNEMSCFSDDVYYQKQGDNLFTKAENIYLKNGEKSRPALILNKTNQAVLMYNTFNYPLAESLLLEVVSLCETEYGRSDPSFETALNNLAAFYYNSGNYKKAEKFFVEAVEIYNKTSAARTPRAASCINNLGALYFEMGNYNIASELLMKSGEIFEHNSQKLHLSYAVVLNNLASLDLVSDYYAKPENKVKDQLVNSGKKFSTSEYIFDQNCQMPHPYGDVIKSNISFWYFMMGDIKKSRLLIWDINLRYDPKLIYLLVNKMPSISSITTGKNQSAHYVLEPFIIPIKIKWIDPGYLQMGGASTTVEYTNTDRAMFRLSFGSGDKIKKALGEYHPGYSETLKMLCFLYKSFGDFSMEEKLMLDYMNIFNHKILQDFTFLSESEKELYYQTHLPEMHSFMVYTLRRKYQNPEITCSAFNNILLYKGLMLKSNTAMRLAILNSKDPVLLKKYDEWISLNKEISALYSTPVEMRPTDVTVLENRANALEKELNQGSQVFSNFIKGTQLTWKDVHDVLKPGEAAIEFTHFKVSEKNMGDEVYYCALILKPDSRYPEMIKLFEEKELEAIIGKTGSTNYDYIRNIYGTLQNPDDRLYKLIWQPLEKYLAKVNTIYLSPSGLLYKISFPAIRNGANVFLCDKYVIQINGSTGNSVIKTDFSSDNRLSAMVFGGIQYNKENAGTRVWNYLEGTKNEAEAIRAILEKGNVEVNCLTDSKATETYFKQYSGKYNVLHIATHGFFYPDPGEEKNRIKSSEVEAGPIVFRGGSTGFGVSSFVNNLNPLMRSGLVFAGANSVWNKSDMDEGDDGVLTAQEVTQVDLRKVGLVVLSACETGLGDIRGSEGVYGLERAFKMSGAKYIIMSLWQVPDVETEEFMVTFYSKLMKSNDTRKAFTETQREMRLKYDPFFWAAFVLME